MTIEKLLIKHEGMRLLPYKCTAGKWTWGVGRNFENNPLTSKEQLFLLNNGITEKTAMYLLQNDIKRVEAELKVLVPSFLFQSHARQMVLIDMCFQLGVWRFGQFKKMLAAIEDDDHAEVAIQMKDSRWARQVPNRAHELCEMWIMDKEEI